MTDFQSSQLQRRFVICDKYIWFSFGTEFDVTRKWRWRGSSCIIFVSGVFFYYCGATTVVGQGLLIIEDSWSQSDTTHSVRLLWTSHQPDAETSAWQHSHETDIHAPGGIRTHNPGKRVAADPHLRLRGHWNRLSGNYMTKIFIQKRTPWFSSVLSLPSCPIVTKLGMNFMPQKSTLKLYFLISCSQ